MTVNFRYNAEDFAEANKAKLAALSGKPVDPAAAKAKSRYGTGVMRWVFWLGMAVFLFSFVWFHGNRPPSRPRLPAPEPPLTHNFLQTLSISVTAPLVLLALIGVGIGAGTARRRIPFYTPKMPSDRIVRSFWRMVAVVCMLLSIGALIASFNLPTAPDWRPDLVHLLFVLFGPWIVWLFLVVMLFRWQTARVKKRQAGELFTVEGSTLLQQQHLEASDDGITVSNPLAAHRYAWTYFVSYLESQNLLTLYTRDLGMQIVPRRAFAEPGSFERFCGLVQTHVAAGQFLPRQSGFAVIAPVPALPIESEMNPRERHAT
ncbi:MAG TPA: YcxB family protein [Humisphaera sp.]|jgi:hypothetical protein|nr:YcxB family protein [Humisphaera sp.]